MTVLQLIIVPAMILIVACGAALAIMARMIRPKWLEWEVHLEAAKRSLDREIGYDAAFGEMLDVLASAIGALESDAPLAEDFPADVREKMITAYEKARDLTRKG